MGWKLTHPDDGMVFACPECDASSQLNDRSDGTVACYDCGHVADGLDAMVERESNRGDNLTEADKQRFASGSDVRYEGPTSPGENPGPDPKYSDLTPEDLGLEEGIPDA